MSDLKALYRADFDSPSGYSRAARAHARALIEAGVDLLFEHHKCDLVSIPLDDFWKKELPARMARNEVCPIKIWHETPEFYSPSPAQLNVAMVAWETSHIPSWDVMNNPRNNWVAQLNKMQAVWTFCHSAKKALERSGVQTLIEVIPHPIDPEVYQPPPTGSPRPELFGSTRRPLPTTAFRFVSVFQWMARKDPMSLLLAYLTEFTPDDDVVLILKTYQAKPGDASGIPGVIQQFRKGLPMPRPHPPIYLLSSVLPDREVAHLLQSCDCYVTTSRAEGFCLPVAEAMACGLPCIVPDGSAFPELVTENNGYLVQTVEEPVHGMPHIPWYYGTQTWHRVQIMDLRRRMREAYDNRLALADRGQQAQKAIRALSPGPIGKRMRIALEDLLARQTRPGPVPVPTASRDPVPAA